jgi:hypothetical protein
MGQNRLNALSLLRIGSDYVKTYFSLKETKIFCRKGQIGEFVRIILASFFCE